MSPLPPGQKTGRAIFGSRRTPGKNRISAMTAVRTKIRRRVANHRFLERPMSSYCFVGNGCLLVTIADQKDQKRSALAARRVNGHTALAYFGDAARDRPC
jgi:hypothetical protein